MKMCLLMRAVLPTDSSCMALGGPFQTVRFEPFFRFGKLSYLFAHSLSKPVIVEMSQDSVIALVSLLPLYVY